MKFKDVLLGLIPKSEVEAIKELLRLMFSAFIVILVLAFFGILLAKWIDFWSAAL